MSILVDANTRVIVQGIVGQEGMYYAEQMLAYGTNIVAGVTPGSGGDWALGKPVFDSVRRAVEVTDANASVIFVDAASAVDAIYEAIEAGLRLIVCVTEGIPRGDVMRLKEYLRMYPFTRLLGPNCSGVLIPEKVSLGIVPAFIGAPGHVGVVSRSGTLMYDVVYALTRAGVGQSTCVGIGGDSVCGTSLVDVLSMFEEDPATRSVVLIGELGGVLELEAARFIQTAMSKPVYAYVVGKAVPLGVRLGHDGAVAQEPRMTAQYKIDMLRSSGVIVVETIEHLIRSII